ncbi:MAG: putative DNA binding domain-containing protein [Anaerolineae bacterium]|nr:putative DNA binding domain-containing protein [Anaerolineae bacterium]
MNTSVEDIRQLIKSGRGLQADWFGDQTASNILAATMAAMANTQGGTLILGIIGQNATIIGVRNAAEGVDLLLQAALSIDPPLIVPLPQVTRINGKAVVLIHIPPGMPHVYALDGRYLQRQGTENITLKSRDLRRLIIERGEISFEAEIPHGANLHDLDLDKARAYVGNLGGIGESTVEQVLVKRGCLVEYEGVLRPTNAGILLFGKDSQRFIRGADITAARFGGETMSDTFTRQDIGGTLPDQIRRAETFLVDHLRKDIHIGQSMARAESFEYPLEAVRELVVNAVAHRDYQITGDGIRLFIFSNRLEITSPGGLPGPVTIDNIKDQRFSRNPAIVQVLSDMGFIERLGYGVDRVIDLMRQQKLHAPEFEEKAGGFRVVLRNELSETQSEIKTVTPSIQFNGIYQGTEINPRQEAALVFLHRESSNYRITNSDLQSLCPEVHPETIRRDLADLVTKNILKKMGQKRGSYYVLNRDEL